MSGNFHNILQHPIQIHVFSTCKYLLTSNPCIIFFDSCFFSGLHVVQRWRANTNDIPTIHEHNLSLESNSWSTIHYERRHMFPKKTRWWFQTFYIFTPCLDRRFPIWRYLSNGLAQPPTRKCLETNQQQDETFRNATVAAKWGFRQIRKVPWRSMTWWKNETGDRKMEEDMHIRWVCFIQSRGFSGILQDIFRDFRWWTIVVWPNIDVRAGCFYLFNWMLVVWGCCCNSTDETNPKRVVFSIDIHMSQLVKDFLAQQHSPPNTKPYLKFFQRLQIFIFVHSKMQKL